MFLSCVGTRANPLLVTTSQVETSLLVSHGQPPLVPPLVKLAHRIMINRIKRIKGIKRNFDGNVVEIRDLLSTQVVETGFTILLKPEYIPGSCFYIRTSL